MPYVKPDVLGGLRDGSKEPSNAGELNAVLTLVAIAYISLRGLSYQNINNVLAAFEWAKDEFKEKNEIHLSGLFQSFRAYRDRKRNQRYARKLRALMGELEDSDSLRKHFLFVVYYHVATYGVTRQRVDDAVGALDGAAREFYRRVAVPYEDKKIKENGDVYPSECNVGEWPPLSPSWQQLLLFRA